MIVEAEVEDRALNWLPDEMRFGPAQVSECESSDQGGGELAAEAAGDPGSEASGEGLPEAA